MGVRGGRRMRWRRGMWLWGFGYGVSPRGGVAFLRPRGSALPKLGERLDFLVGEGKAGTPSLEVSFELVSSLAVHPSTGETRQKKKAWWLPWEVPSLYLQIEANMVDLNAAGLCFDSTKYHCVFIKYRFWACTTQSL